MLYEYARENPSFNEEIQRNRSERNLKTTAWVLGAIVSTIAAVGAIIALGLVAPIGAPFVALLPAIATSIAVSIPVQWASENVFESIGEKLTGLDKKTTLEHVGAIERDQYNGHVISQERVMATYVSASPDLQEMIKRDFGRNYEKLSLQNKDEVMLRYGEAIGLSNVTHAINQRVISAKELAFSVHGDRSNAYPEPTLYEQTKEYVHAMKHHLAQKRQHAAEKWDHFAQQVKSKKEDVAHKLVDTREQWVSKLGFAPKAQEAEQGWADRVTANTNTPAVGLGG
jgi:hypothetical protein